MRSLRVLGLSEDGTNVVCADQETGEYFALPADERLRAAARGDLARMGQLDLDSEPTLRPREIQARIRAGASIADVARAASTGVGRIERYAYPVLLERSTMAERARRAHPVVDSSPAKKTLEELVTATLAERGQAEGMRWDAYRDDAGWVLVLRWTAGRSENRARWAVDPGPRTQALRPKDEAARELLEPARPGLRTIGEDGFRAALPHAETGAAAGAPVSAPTPDQPAPTPFAAPAPAPAGQPAAAELPVEKARSASESAAPPAEEIARTGTETPSVRPARRNHRPAMPGWEDVLLGGRPAEKH